ncbi:MAG TPA: beta-ketoacyl-[acyl-carrier-protein] synthase family protein [Thermomicrobiaceae bacterium]|nr:beta-ketoacyl-[acyl-carrier-protein] synthase family protein [Thermomicrobiaceae bacterium]
MTPGAAVPKRQRVVVTGIGIVSPLGAAVEEFWRASLAGESGVVSITDLDLANCRTKIGARVAGYDPGCHFSARELQRLSFTSQLALVAAHEALTGCGLADDGCRRAAAGVILGTAAGVVDALKPLDRYFFEHNTIRDPLTIPRGMCNAAASNLSIRFGLKGPVMTIDAACASSAHAIGYAYNLIRTGMLSLAVTGGTDSAISELVVYGFSCLRALSERNETPAQACRPFSRDRDGTVLGEGAGILILESEQSALERGAPILAELTGYGATSDGFHLTQPALEGVSEAMRLALADAGLEAADINYINAHGTATLANDKIEAAAIRQVFGDAANDVPVVGIKPAVGHSIGAASAIELISCVLSIRDSFVPPTLNFMVPDPECDLDCVPEGARRREIRHAMSNSFAFGGSNAVLIVSRYAG